MRHIKVKKVNCNICNSENYSLFVKGKDHLLNTDNVYTAVKCNNCDFIYLNPRPIDLLSLHEEDSYDLYSLKPKEKTNTFVYSNLRKIWRVFIRLIFGKNNWLLKGIKKGKLLDVGCSSGSYIYELKQRGWDVTGVEPNTFAAKKAKELGLNIINSTLENAKINTTFEVISMKNVIEHLPNPQDTLKIINNCLNKNGLLLILLLVLFLM